MVPENVTEGFVGISLCLRVNSEELRTIRKVKKKEKNSKARKIWEKFQVKNGE